MDLRSDRNRPLASVDDQSLTCRICLSSDDPDSLIAPCLCAGTQKWVHRGCLDEWRAQEQVPLAFGNCPTCKFSYRTRVVDSDEQRDARILRFRLFVARDAVGLFVLVQSTLALTAFLMHMLDTSEWIASLYPTEWAESHAAFHLSIGPYYVSTVFLLLVLLGLGGVVLKLSGRLPTSPATRRRPRAHTVDPQLDCSCTACPVDCCDCLCNTCGRVCRGGCAESGPACEVGACPEGEGAAICVPVLLALAIVFAVIGVFVGIFFSTILIQRIGQKHVHLLQMRSETQRIVVVDLADRPDLRMAEPQAHVQGGGVSSSAPLPLHVV